MIFIETTIFTKLFPKYLTDDEYRVFQWYLLLNPEAGILFVEVPEGGAQLPCCVSELGGLVGAGAATSAGALQAASRLASNGPQQGNQCAISGFFKTCCNAKTISRSEFEPILTNQGKN